jgi:hypothetical protein
MARVPYSSYSSRGRLKHLLVALLLVLSACAAVTFVFAAAAPSGLLYVTYVNVQPSSVQPGDSVTVVFDVVYFTSQPYAGNISIPAVGLKTATLLLGSDQLREFPNVPLSPGAKDGEYEARIQIPQDVPVGIHTLYVKAQSLQLVVNGIAMTGPATDVSYKETETTSDYSDLQVQPTPTILTRLLASTQDLVLLVLAIIILIIVALSVFARHKRMLPTKRKK